MIKNNNSYEVSEARVFFIIPVILFLSAAGLIVIALALGVDPDELRVLLIIALVLALLGALTMYELVHRRLRILYPGQTYCYYPFLGGAKHFTRYDIARVVIGFSAARGEYVRLLGHAEETICTLETNMANIMVFVKEMMECGVPIEDNTAYTGRILQQPRTMPDVAYVGEDLRTEGEGRYVKEPEAPRNTTRSGRAVIIIGGILFLAALGATVFFRVQDVARLDHEGRELQITSRREEEDEEENITVADLDEETLRWIYAANAMVYDEAFDPFFIGGLDPEKEGNVRRMQRELESAWGAENRRDTVESFNTLLVKGHRAGCLDYIETIRENGWDELSSREFDRVLADIEDTETRLRTLAAYEAYTHCGEAQLIGWDYTRALRILDRAYIAGYIDLREYIKYAVPVAKKLQEIFYDWDDLWWSFACGNLYWGWKNYDPDMTTASFEELYEAGVYLRASHCREEWDAAGIDFPSFQETRLTDAVRE